MLKDRDKMRLQAAETKVLRSVVGVTRLECVRNEVIRNKYMEEGSSGRTGEEKEGGVERKGDGEWR